MDNNLQLIIMENNEKYSPIGHRYMSYITAKVSEQVNKKCQ